MTSRLLPRDHRKENPGSLVISRLTDVSRARKLETPSGGLFPTSPGGDHQDTAGQERHSRRHRIRSDFRRVAAVRRNGAAQRRQHHAETNDPRGNNNELRRENFFHYDYTPVQSLERNPAKNGRYPCAERCLPSGGLTRPRDITPRHTLVSLTKDLWPARTHNQVLAWSDLKRRPRLDHDRKCVCNTLLKYCCAHNRCYVT